MQYNKTLLSIIIIVLVWLICILFTNPFHNFPLNDDWSYAFTVKQLIEHGKYQLTNWIAGPQVTQTLWGALFCLPFGFSFIALKVSTVVIAIISIVTFFYITINIFNNIYLSIVTTLLLAFNPLFFSLSVTFMTDIHFFAWFILSFLCFIKNLKNNSNLYLFLGTFFSTAAILTRQFGIVAPASMLLYYIINKQNKKTEIIKYLSSTLLVFATYMLYTKWLENNNMLPTFYRSITESIFVNPVTFVTRFYNRLGCMLTDIGLVLLPLSIYIIVKQISFLKTNKNTIAIISVILIFPLLKSVSSLPTGNIFNYSYTGVLSTYDVYALKIYPDWAINKQINFVLTNLSAIGGMALIVAFTINLIKVINNTFNKKNRQTNYSNAHRLIFLIAIVTYIGVILINYTYFDRYLIPLFFLVSIFIIGNTVINKKILLPTLFYIIFIAGIIIPQTKKYNSWNKARWQLANQAISKGINPKTIDGGHEFNGWHGAEIKPDGMWDTTLVNYIVSFSKLNNCIVTNQKEFCNNQFIYLLKKQ